jgi:hypothetical protein
MGQYYGPHGYDTTVWWMGTNLLKDDNCPCLQGRRSEQSWESHRLYRSTGEGIVTGYRSILFTFGLGLTGWPLFGNKTFVRLVCALKKVCSGHNMSSLYLRVVQFES